MDRETVVGQLRVFARVFDAASSLSHDGSDFIQCQVPKKQITTLAEECVRVGIQHHVNDDGIEVAGSEDGCRFFCSIEQYVDLIAGNMVSLDQDYFVVDLEGKALAFYSVAEGSFEYYGENGDETRLRIENINRFFKLMAFIQNEVADHYASEKNTMIFLSPQYGRFEVRKCSAYDIRDVERPPSLDIIDQPKNPTTQPLLKFLAAEIASMLWHVDEKDRCAELYKSFDNLVSAADNSFDVYIHSLSYKQTVELIEKERSEFFETIRSILDKIMTTAMSIPITFAAAIFANYQIESPMLGYLILGTFIVFSLYPLNACVMFLSDTEDLRDRFNGDIQRVTMNSDKILDKIQSQVDTVRHRLDHIRWILISIIALIAILDFGIIGSKIYQRFQEPASVTPVEEATEIVPEAPSIQVEPSKEIETNTAGQ